MGTSSVFGSIIPFNISVCLSGDRHAHELAIALEKALKVNMVDCDWRCLNLYSWSSLILLLFLCRKFYLICFCLILQLKGTVRSKRQHVHDCRVVRAKRLYGYYKSEEFFLKIYLYPTIFICKTLPFIWKIFWLWYLLMTLTPLKLLPTWCLPCIHSSFGMILVTFVFSVCTYCSYVVYNSFHHVDTLFSRMGEFLIKVYSLMNHIFPFFCSLW